MTTPILNYELLALLGFTVTHVPASWEDDGDAENGPHLTGGPAFDEWTRPGDSHAVIVVDGDVVAVEPIQPDPCPFYDTLTPTPTQPESTMTNANTAPFDLNAILSAAVAQIVTQATASLAARVDQLERVTATQNDVISALLQGLNRVEGIVDGTDTEAANLGALEARLDELANRAQEDRTRIDTIDRRLGVIERTLYACAAGPDDDRVLPVALMQDVEREVESAVSAAMRDHANEYDHDEFGPAVDEEELERLVEKQVESALEDAIEEHKRDTQHLGDSDIEEALDEHCADREHTSDADLDRAIKAVLDEEMTERVRDALATIGSVIARVVFE